MRVTTKGQVTIPQTVREKLGIFPGTEVEFIFKGDAVELEKVKPRNGRQSRGQRAVALLRNSATNRTMTTDEILELTRGTD